MSKQTETFLFLLGISGIFAALRLDGENSAIFQALAHIWIGFLLGAVYLTRSKAAGFNLLWLTAVEIYAFFGKSLNL